MRLLLRFFNFLLCNRKHDESLKDSLQGATLAFKIPGILPYENVSAYLSSQIKIEVKINGKAWKKVDSFFDSSSTDQAYIVRITEEGVMIITFGDGKHGARLPTGTNNVVASYRTGAGAKGRVVASCKEKSDFDLIYLDVWQQEVEAVEDPELINSTLQTNNDNDNNIA